MIQKEEAPVLRTEAPVDRSTHVTFRQTRDGNKVTLYVTRDDGAEVSERIPLHVVDKWPVDKQEWYLRSVAITMRRRLARIKRKATDASPSGLPSSPENDPSK